MSSAYLGTSSRLRLMTSWHCQREWSVNSCCQSEMRKLSRKKTELKNSVWLYKKWYYIKILKKASNHFLKYPAIQQLIPKSWPWRQLNRDLPHQPPLPGGTWGISSHTISPCSGSVLGSATSKTVWKDIHYLNRILCQNSTWYNFKNQSYNMTIYWLFS